MQQKVLKATLWTKLPIIVKYENRPKKLALFASLLYEKERHNPERSYIRVASGRNEIYTAVDPAVWYPLLPVNIEFFLEILFILVIDELHDGLPTAQRNKK